ncbi:hypothetical protein LMG23994_01696 [Cupriavidus pinatubonensis]|uniref:Secreted protein n=1 Tax=Cupriavidus pinatubonensis TaxID=248026 RepID=A0ABN7Y9C3_9BURK|nr:hypothetical protein LMG23994_01696 [Cupriavidus pinatubonensis]
MMVALATTGSFPCRPAAGTCDRFVSQLLIHADAVCNSMSGHQGSGDKYSRLTSLVSVISFRDV